MSDYVSCPACGEDVTEDSEFCPHCGMIFEQAETIPCENHGKNHGTSICIICRKVLCAECTRTQGGRRFCTDHQSVKVEQDWAEVFRSTEINDAELVKSVLENAEFHVQVRNFNSIGFVWDGGGDSPQSRSNLGKPAEVFVPIPEYLKARNILQEWESGNVNQE